MKRFLAIGSLFVFTSMSASATVDSKSVSFRITDQAEAQELFEFGNRGPNEITNRRLFGLEGEREYETSIINENDRSLKCYKLIRQSTTSSFIDGLSGGTVPQTYACDVSVRFSR